MASRDGFFTGILTDLGRTIFIIGFVVTLSAITSPTPLVSPLPLDPITIPGKAIVTAVGVAITATGYGLFSVVSPPTEEFVPSNNHPD